MPQEGGIGRESRQAIRVVSRLHSRQDGRIGVRDVRPRAVWALREDGAVADGGTELRLDEAAKAESHRRLPLGPQRLLPPRRGVDGPALAPAARSLAAMVTGIHRAS